jgi:Zn-dependent peptidase ImmA (M78 family)
MDYLAKISGISKSAIAKIESGERSPKSDTISKLARAFGVPHESLFRQNNMEPVLELKGISLREGEKAERNELEFIKSEIKNRLINFISLERIAEFKQVFVNPIKDLEIKSKQDVKKAVKILRKKWKAGNAPIQSAVDFIEDKGIKVFEVISSEKFEGFSAWAGEIPVIVINAQINELTRIRFTAFHELGHIVLQFEDDLDIAIIEKLCNKFSSYFLLSTEAIVSELGPKRTKCTIEELKNVKAKYGISILAVIYGAVDADIIDWPTCYAWRAVYDKKYAEEEDFGTYVGNEKPKRFMRLLYEVLAGNKITMSKAASLARKSESEFIKQFKYFE